MKNYEMREKIFRMSLVRKVVEAFVAFPYKRDYVRMLVSNILNDSHEKDMSLELSYETSMHISIEVRNKQIAKYYDIDDIPKPYTFTFIPDLTDTIPNQGSVFDPKYKRLDCDDMDKQDADIVCHAALPFILKRDRSDIPLLVNIYPEFAKYALAWKSRCLR
jgi:hypothetical protein